MTVSPDEVPVTPDTKFPETTGVQPTNGTNGAINGTNGSSNGTNGLPAIKADNWKSAADFLRRPSTPDSPDPSDGSTPESGQTRRSPSCRYSFNLETIHRLRAASLASSSDADSPTRRKESLARRWMRSFIQTDPRKQIEEFFRKGDERGPLGYLRREGLIPRGQVSSFFTVWRPTSLDAIRMMMEGRATGKGLNVKGKSAKCGVLSGFVPFLQISEEKHKALIGTSPKSARIRVFFGSSSCRQQALEALQPILSDMMNTAEPAEALVAEHNSGRITLNDEDFEEALLDMRFSMDDPQIHLIDGIPEAYGVDIPERLFAEAFIVRQDISHEKDWETGRASEPAFMDLNFHATREGQLPKAVIWQYDHLRPLNPRGLLVAYEEERVRPVASDLDAFLIGTSGMGFEALPEDQIEMLRWLINHVEGVLSEPQPHGWTKRWLDVLKAESKIGFHPVIPKYGYGDPTSTSVMMKAVEGLNMTGAVRHGAECFNFYFPQELDHEYLIVWEGFKNLPWRYLNEPGLREFLSERISDGFSFPLNPKWILCDAGWRKVFEELLASEGAKEALDAWYPPNSGVRERLEEISKIYPEGFKPILKEGEEFVEMDQDLADFELKRYQTLQRARRKLKVILMFRSLSFSSSEPAKKPVTTEDDDESEDSPTVLLPPRTRTWFEELVEHFSCTHRESCFHPQSSGSIQLQSFEVVDQPSAPVDQPSAPVDQPSAPDSQPTSELTSVWWTWSWPELWSEAYIQSSWLLSSWRVKGMLPPEERRGVIINEALIAMLPRPLCELSRSIKKRMLSLLGTVISQNTL
ncbi:hypothetical protein CYMTET_43457 [Cymbomonas tetramitiformis]|uniref:Uncharacterized protein n=1 Tax=Cymbomonas tetramitiformis TaxID=36881 RepID=A0AAE0C269_9CHLO|nr:hypothetical protein CYMTET_43457 [Cymbomonas tetramitiformis]